MCFYGLASRADVNLMAGTGDFLVLVPGIVLRDLQRTRTDVAQSAAPSFVVSVWIWSSDGFVLATNGPSSNDVAGPRSSMPSTCCGMSLEQPSRFTSSGGTSPNRLLDFQELVASAGFSNS